MAAKDVKFSTEARERMLRGVDTLANAQRSIRLIRISFTVFCQAAPGPG
jgi:hypothetical protein